MDNKRYLITGGTGFIGSHLANKLADLGKDVYVISHSKNNLWRIDNKDKINIKFADLKDLNRLRKVISEIKPDIIFHLAAYVNASRDFNGIDKALDTNFNGTLNLLKALNEIEYDLFVNTGTCEEYGTGKSPFNENQKEHPVSPYSLSKTCTTYLCELFSKIYDNPIMTVRPFLTYGPKQTSKMLIPELINNGLNKTEMKLTPGEQTRDFIFVDDLIEGYLTILNNYKKFNEYKIYNIGTGKQILIKDVVNIVSDFIPENDFKLGARSYRKGETMEFYSDNTSLKELGWQSKISIEKGLEMTINWWKNYLK